MVYSAAIVTDFVESSSRLTEILRQNDFVTRFITFRDEEKVLKSLTNPIIFIQFSDEKNLVQQRIKDIIHKAQEDPGYARNGLVVMGPEISFFNELIGGFFPKVACVNTPFNAVTVKRALDIVTSSGPSATTQKNSMPLPSKFLNVFGSDNVFKQIQEQNLGGENYLKCSSPEDIADKSYLCEREDVAKELDSIESVADEWELGHIHRTAHLSYQILETLGHNPKSDESFLIASNLYCTSLLQNPRFIRSDPISNSKLCVEISQSLRSSAETIRAKTNDSSSAKIVMQMANIIAGIDKRDESESVNLTAQAIIGADIFDRACWQTGVWEPSAAHKVLVKFRDNNLFNLSSDITACLIKFVLEALEATNPKRILSSSVSGNAALEELADSQNDAQLGENERLVGLSQLIPGMLLKKPIMAYDGKMVIPKDITLDIDMIWRLWCLCAVRPINTPIHVKTK